MAYVEVVGGRGIELPDPTLGQRSLFVLHGHASDVAHWNLQIVIGVAPLVRWGRLDVIGVDCGRRHGGGWCWIRAEASMLYTWLRALRNSGVLSAAVVDDAWCGAELPQSAKASDRSSGPNSLPDPENPHAPGGDRNGRKRPVCKRRAPTTGSEGCRH